MSRDRVVRRAAILIDRDLLIIGGRAVDEGGLVGRVALLPLGSVEYHGPHSPLGTDILIARELARRVALAFDDLIVLPELAYTACAVETRTYLGTLSVDPEVVTALLEAVFVGLFRTGLAGVIVLNAHSGNVAPTVLAADRVSEEFADRFVALVSWWETLPADEVKALTGFTQDGGHGHGGPVEMSVMKAIHPDLVHSDWAEELDVPEKIKGDALRVVSNPAQFIDWKGYHGRASEIDLGTGERLLELVVSRIVTSIESLLGRRDSA